MWKRGISLDVTLNIVKKSIDFPLSLTNIKLSFEYAQISTISSIYMENHLLKGIYQIAQGLEIVCSFWSPGHHHSGPIGFVNEIHAFICECSNFVKSRSICLHHIHSLMALMLLWNFSFVTMNWLPAFSNGIDVIGFRYVIWVWMWLSVENLRMEIMLLPPFIDDGKWSIVALIFPQKDSYFYGKMIIQLLK